MDSYLRTIASNITLQEPGVWVASNRSTISYPEEGNDLCFALEDDSFWFQHRNKCITQLVTLFYPSGPLFDIGGGNGVVTRALQHAGIESVLVEPGQRGVMNARARGVRPIIWATLQDAGFQPHRLPAVGLFDVLEHIEDDLGFLQTIRQLLQPGGLVYLSVPAYKWLWSAEDTFAGHQRRYTQSGLCAVLRQAGFRVEFATYMFSFLPIPVFFLRTIPSLLRLRTHTSQGVHQREHRSANPLVGNVLQRLLDYEIRLLAQQRALPGGGSCLIAARSPK